MRLSAVSLSCDPFNRANRTPRVTSQSHHGNRTRPCLPLHMVCVQTCKSVPLIKKLRGRDLNPQPVGYEPTELPLLYRTVTPTGFEPVQAGRKPTVLPLYESVIYPLFQRTKFTWIVQINWPGKKTGPSYHIPIPMK